MAKRRSQKQKINKPSRLRPKQLLCAHCLGIKGDDVGGRLAITIISGNAICGRCLIEKVKLDKSA